MIHGLIEQEPPPLPKNSSEMVLELRRPIENIHTHEVISALTLVEPTAAQWIAAAKIGGGEGDLTLLAQVTKIDRGTLAQLAVSDYAKATSFLSAFVRDALQTGES